MTVVPVTWAVARRQCQFGFFSWSFCKSGFLFRQLGIAAVQVSFGHFWLPSCVSVVQSVSISGLGGFQSGSTAWPIVGGGPGSFLPLSRPFALLITSSIPVCGEKWLRPSPRCRLVVQSACVCASPSVLLFVVGPNRSCTSPLVTISCVCMARMVVTGPPLSCRGHHSL